MERTPVQRTFPTDCYYDSRTHLWMRLQSDPETVVVGMDVLGLESLGDLAYIALPEVGSRAERGRPVGTLEAAKMTGELIAPVSGTVLARNESVLRDPSLVNRDPYGSGWLFTLAPAQWDSEVAGLIHGDGVAAWVEAEIRRYAEQGWIHDA